VIARAMAKDRDERYQSCGELIAAARSAALQRPTSAPTAHVSEPALGASGPVASPPTALAGAPSPGPPGAPSEPSPPAQPPAPPPPQSAPAARRRLPPWVAIAAALVAAAVAGVVVYVATRGSEPASSETPSAAPQPATTEPAATEPPATEPPATEPSATEPPATVAPASEEAVLEEGLAPIVDPEIWQDCAVESTPNPGATETAVCLPPAGETRRFDSVELSLYPDADSLAAAYEALRADAGVERDRGRCNATRWTGEGAWLHGEDKPGGRRFCYFDESGNVVIVWTHEKLGQPTHLDTLGIARRDDTNHADLFAWWNFWVHQIGLTQTR